MQTPIVITHDRTEAEAEAAEVCDHVIASLRGLSCCASFTKGSRNQPQVGDPMIANFDRVVLCCSFSIAHCLGNCIDVSGHVGPPNEVCLPRCYQLARLLT